MCLFDVRWAWEKHLSCLINGEENTRRMAIEGAALSHLKDAYYILTHDLVDIDLLSLKQKIDKSPKSIEVAQDIAPVISKLAITMMQFGSAVVEADTLISTSLTSTQLMKGLLITIIVIGVVGAMIAFFLILRSKIHGFNVFETVPVAGGSLIGVVLFVTFLLAWVYLLNDRIRRLRDQKEVLKAGFWRVNNNVSRAYVMRFEAASQQGTLSEFANSQTDGSDLTPGSDCTDDPTDSSSAAVCNAQINLCATVSPSLVQVIQNSCEHEVSKLLTELETIRFEGIDGFDRMVLWKTISDGVDAIRQTISLSANSEYSTSDKQVSPLQASEADIIIDTQVIPILCNQDLQNMTNDTPAIAFQGKPSAYTRTTKEKIMSNMVINILMIVQSSKYDIEISDFRMKIEDALKQFYTKYESLKDDLMSVVDKVQHAADVRAPPATSLYVDASTMLARVKDIGVSAWGDLVIQTKTTQNAVRTFLFKFHKTTRSLGLDIASMVTKSLTFVAFVALLMFITNTLDQLWNKHLDFQVAARSIVIASCLFALATVSLGEMVTRKRHKHVHNDQAMSRNGQKLAYSLETTREAASTIEESSTPLASDAQSYVAAAVTTIRAYDACNSVTNGSRTMPFPVMDLIVYAFIVVVIVGSMAYAINALKPLENISNIRLLMRMKDSLLDGEVPEGLSKQIGCCVPNANVLHILMWLAVVVLFTFNAYAITNIESSDDNFNASLQLVDDCV